MRRAGGVTSPRNVGPDGISRAFLTDLVNLHANTAYLVKLKATRRGDARGTGTPVVEDHHWIKGSYNLTGFPIAPGAPTVADSCQGSPPAAPLRSLRFAR